MSAALAAQPIGSAAIPEAEAKIPPTSLEDIDKALLELDAAKKAWTEVSLAERIELLECMMRDMNKVADGWIAAAMKAKGLSEGQPGVGEEWLAGPFTTQRNLRLLVKSLTDIIHKGRPMPPGPVKTLPNGKVSVGVFPYETWDKLFFTGFEGEIWMEDGVTAANLADHQAKIYRDKAEGKTSDGAVALVLGAGNVASIGPMDALYKLFVEDQVVLLKMNPVNEYLGPFIQEAFKVMVDRGFFRIIYGGAKQGAYACQHERTAEIHITGSDKTHDAIVYGVGEEGAANKAARKPVNERRISSELGNVSPVIVVPGPWKQGDIVFQGTNLASSVTNNAGFNCNCTRAIITHKGWDQREALLDQIRATMRSAPIRKAYYPGAKDRWQTFVDAHPEAELIGTAGEDELPWTFIPGLDPNNTDDICFKQEAFCAVFGETSLEADSVVDYIEKAVDFANDTMWGTLNCAIIVHPDSLKDPKIKAAVDKAIADLRFGSIAINHWPALAYGLVTTTWGAYPGHEMHDIQSGRDVVHNTFMFDKVYKCVVKGPFKFGPMDPTPAWFVSNKNGANLGKKLFEFEGGPGWLKVPGVVLQALKG